MLGIEISPMWVTILMLGILAIGIFSGFPLAFILAGVGFVFGFLFLPEGRIFGIAIAQTWKTMTNYVIQSIKQNQTLDKLIREHIFDVNNIWYPSLQDKSYI